MRSSYIRIIGALLVISAISFFSCDRDPVPPPDPVPDRITIADLRDLYGGSNTVVDTNVYIHGIVTLTPESNNVPDFIAYIEDATGGIALTVSGTNSMAMGSEVKIQCRGSQLTVYNGLMQFGDIDIASQVEVLNLSAGLPQPVTVTISELLAGDYQGVYVAIADVEFVETGTLSGSKTLNDCSETIAVFTRSQALFSGSAIPPGNGIFKGIASHFNQPQLIIVDPAHLDMPGSKVCGSGPVSWVNENFESLANYDPVEDLEGWKNLMQAGTRKWLVRAHDGNKYAQMTAFNSNEASNIGWMITPPQNLTGATDPVLTFRSKGGYDNGAALETLISTNYDGGNTPWSATWTVLPASYPSAPSNTYGNWGNSGEISLSAYSGTVYIAFRYTGGHPGSTTTWQVDDVKIAER